MRRFLIGPLVGTAALSLLVSCGGEDQDLAVPEEVCGAVSEPDSLRRLLPAGDEFADEVSPMSPGGGGENCDITVDGRGIIMMAIYLYPEYTDPMEYAVTYGGSETEAVQIGGYDAGSWPDGIMTYVPCFAEATEARGTHIGLRVSVGRGLSPIEDDDERAEAIRVFAGDFVEGLKEAKGCEV